MISTSQDRIVEVLPVAFDFQAEPRARVGALEGRDRLMPRWLPGRLAPLLSVLNWLLTRPGRPSDLFS